MEGEDRVVLLGVRGSPFVLGVELALKVKGIAYEYVVEDLQNKSELLLKYNPVHQKVPVLIHNGKPIVESLIILEYIDETWKDNAPKLLPVDPFARAKVRFWCSFVNLQFFGSMRQVIMTDGEAQEKAIKEAHEKVKFVEEGLMVEEFFPTDIAASIAAGKLGMHDLVACSAMGSYKAVEEALGLKLFDPERNPMIISWVTALNEIPGVEEMRPPLAQSVAYVKFMRQSALQAPRA